MDEFFMVDDDGGGGRIMNVERRESVQREALKRVADARPVFDCLLPGRQNTNKCKSLGG